MRIIARIDDATSERIERIRSFTGWTVADIIERGVALVEKEQVKPENSPWNIAMASELIGCADVDENLSSTYNLALTISLSEKMGYQG